MRLVRFQYKHEAPVFGWILNDFVGKIEGDPFGNYRRMEAEIPLNEVRLLAPVQPSKIICVGHNYKEHIKEREVETPKLPLLFFKPPSSIINPGDTIKLPPQSARVDHEAELVAVVGKRGRHITAESARDFIYGYTIGNDVTARDLQKMDGQWTRGKGFDTFCPFGPWIDTEFDASDALITCKVSGQPRQMGSTRDLIFNVDAMVAFISSVMTLEPGDLIFTGTPAGIGPLVAGDEVVIEIEGLGKLSNPVAAE
ncbi:MAG: 2-hydroxyhepta-2,4-diene-1,7-dioate isomerase [Chloroflexi bacterium GWB2_49_20]|nr:MAG: 2-hydroxyhepta-2,4-diene-1,7-dioate isomerase [Chloroflexi bacterium GWB2_49_20]OGN79860.1 MAG: 2-hydroxyhepta-2,4-diene-1,7-dioate isomerase [Chloroflexi bacterium GWC2_49_37]OGN85605.1 MAG: 2-hydroxyhepta-2,4-diene-1,7-dioate isomerase [Chloroflexi bacterium GWD2_49_16]HBG74483.1 2-hydroxyhepta-2,4-diene-1,7-dioate isomerase [Anaerolineae bacterium]HCC79644.1 2-hydroxyhepta-2,4-diene-1,7-dioate isomerase [Anaerolineae bacterium]